MCPIGHVHEVSEKMRCDALVCFAVSELFCCVLPPCLQEADKKTRRDRNREKRRREAEEALEEQVGGWALYVVL